MIPTTNDILTSEFEFDTQPSKNYKMHREGQAISGFCDGLEAMEQVIYKILNTERYEYVIYSWNYGVELLDLFGEPVSYVCAELKRRISEAILQDERIKAVDSFSFDTTQKGKVYATFTAHTIFGNVETGLGVEY